MLSIADLTCILPIWYTESIWKERRWSCERCTQGQILQLFRRLDSFQHNSSFVSRSLFSSCDFSFWKWYCRVVDTLLKWHDLQFHMKNLSAIGFDFFILEYLANISMENQKWNNTYPSYLWFFGIWGLFSKRTKAALLFRWNSLHCAKRFFHWHTRK